VTENHQACIATSATRWERAKRWIDQRTGGLAGEFVVLSGSTVLLQGATVIVSVVLAGILGPVLYGDWNLVVIVVTYLSYLQFGVTNAMNREVPIAIGAEELDRAHLIRSVALGGSLVAALLGGVIITCIPPDWISPNLRRAALLGGAVYLFGYHAFAYMKTHFESAMRFDRSSMLKAILAALTIVLTLPLAVRWGVSGAITGQGLAYLAASGLAFVLTRVDVRPAFDLTDWKRLVQIGLPIMLVGIAYTVLTTIDRWILIRYVGAEAVGLYAFVVRLLSPTLLLTGLIAAQMYPRVAQEWGRNRSVSSLMPLVKGQVIATLGLTGAVSVSLLAILPVVVPRLWPDFSRSMEILPILLVGMLFLPQCGIFGVLLNVLDRQVPYLLVQVLMVGLALAIGIPLTKAFGLIGTAWAASATYLLYLVSMIVVTGFVLRAVQREFEPGRGRRS